MAVRSAAAQASLAQQLDRVVGAYDVRGQVPAELNDEVVLALGWAVGQVMYETYQTTEIVIGHDMRPDSQRFAGLLAHGIAASGYTSTDLGLCSTDQLYFASGHYSLPGLMVTASHNPAGYNGIKMCGPKATGISRDDVLGEIARRAVQAPALSPAAEVWAGDEAIGKEIAQAFARAIRTLAGLDALADNPDFAVIADCGNGMAGKLIGEVFGGDAGLEPLPVNITALYPELDGTFPNHPANPLDPENLKDVQQAVQAGSYSLGLAFDGDADRCFFIDENGVAASPSAIGALVAQREITRAQAQGEPAPTVLYNALTTRSVPAAIAAAGGIGVRTKVGHSGIKQLMAARNAVFAAEHSAHFYFREFWGADSGLLAACHVLAALNESSKPLSALIAEHNPASVSGEINSSVADPDAALAAVREAAQAGAFGPGEIDELDGVTFSAAEFWLNVRKSNTEPLVRFNAETNDPQLTAQLTESVLGLIRSV